MSRKICVFQVFVSTRTTVGIDFAKLMVRIVRIDKNISGVFKLKLEKDVLVMLALSYDSTAVGCKARTVM
jgi:hypothetical protein